MATWLPWLWGKFTPTFLVTPVVAHSAVRTVAAWPGVPRLHVSPSC